MNYRRLSSSSSDNPRSTSTKTAAFFEHLTIPPVNVDERRYALLPAYPSSERHSGKHADDHLLLANLPRM